MNPLFWTVLTASLVGSLHCAGMCGGLVAVYAVDGERAPHVAYHAGRLATYAALGAIAGALGGLLDLAGELVGIATLAAVVAGATVALWGVFKLLALYDDRIQGVALPAWAQKRLGAMMARLRRHPPRTRAGLLGLATGLLPCGWLYAFIAVAAGTGSPLFGAGVMAAFWAGSVPALAAIGVGVRRIAEPLGRRLPVISALALIAVGLGTVAMRASKTDSIARWLEVKDAAAVAAPAADAPAKPHCH